MAEQDLRDYQVATPNRDSGGEADAQAAHHAAVAAGSHTTLNASTTQRP